MRWLLLTLLLFPTPFVLADEKPAPLAVPVSVAKLAAQAKKSIVVIRYTGRDGRQVGLGTGFVIAKDGLIATNYHVIGDARPISVQMLDGSSHDVVIVHAADRNLDLAVVRIERKDLTPLPLGDSKSLQPGQPIAALGHPRGLENSVVAGVLSGQRELDGVNMLQIAMPIEQGNSGGPVLDMEGRVVGIVSMKSLVTANLGFAVPVSALKKLLARPNPIAMEKWLTIGALDKNDWKAVMGGRWRQRAGRIIADGAGTGFGGRTLCYWRHDPPKEPYEVTVTAKLDDEAGAAGLIFGGDGGQKQYGFYPSGGKLRVTLFDGPDVFSWKILHQIASEHYRPGDWNTLKVRIEKDRFLCFVNDKQVAEQSNPDYPGAKVGLAKFRDTVAEFKRFLVAERVPTGALDPKVVSRLNKTIAALAAERHPSAGQLKPFLQNPGASLKLLRERARQLEKEAENVRQLASSVHEQHCLNELAAEIQKKDSSLARAALIIAFMDNEDLDIDAYLREIDSLSRQIKPSLPKDANAAQRRAALDKFLFKEQGFHGSHNDYYTRNNSYLNEVIDDREGLPITLSVLYMELARRLDLRVVGVALPGHFVVRYEPKEGAGQLIDVYEGGKPMSAKEAEDKVLKITGRPLQEKDLVAVSNTAILQRMLHNLLNVAEGEKDRAGVLRYLDGIITLAPDAYEERWARAVFRFQAGRRAGALEDCDYLLENGPESLNKERVQELKNLLKSEK